MIFGLTIDGRAIKISIFFTCACLVMTGYYIAAASTPKNDDVIVLRADGGQYDGGLAGPTGGQGDTTGEDAQNSAETADEDSAAEGLGPSPRDAGGDAMSTAAQSYDAAAIVRDGYSVPGGAPGGAVSEAEKIYVYVTGAVRNPGVYEMARSSMVIDAVEQAGGFTEQADAEQVNMVFRLESNAMLNIKRKPVENAWGYTKPEEGGAPAADGAAAPVIAPNGSELYGGAVEITYDYDGVLMTGDNAARDGDGAALGSRVNINTASAEELATLPGVGSATANNIIAYREKQKFNRIEDLMKVSGIKQAKFDAVKDLITC